MDISIFVNDYNIVLHIKLIFYNFFYNFISTSVTGVAWSARLTADSSSSCHTRELVESPLGFQYMI